MHKITLHTSEPFDRYYYLRGLGEPPEPRVRLNPKAIEQAVKMLDIEHPAHIHPMTDLGMGSVGGMTWEYLEQAWHIWIEVSHSYPGNGMPTAEESARVNDPRKLHYGANEGLWHELGHAVYAEKLARERGMSVTDAYIENYETVRRPHIDGTPNPWNKNLPYELRVAGHKAYRELPDEAFADKIANEYKEKLQLHF